MSQIEAYYNGVGVGIDGSTNVVVGDSRLLAGSDGMTVTGSQGVLAAEVTAYDNAVTGFDISFSSYVTLSSVRAVQSNKNVFIQGGQSVIVEYSVFRDGFWGVYGTVPAGGLQVTNSLFSNNTYGVIARANDAWIHNNLLTDNTTGIYDLLGNDTLMTNNTISGGTYGVLERAAGARMQDNMVTGNIFGVYAFATSTGFEAENNNFWDNTTDKTGPVTTLSEWTVDPIFEGGFYYTEAVLKGAGLMDRWDAEFYDHVTGLGDDPLTYNQVDIGYHHATNDCSAPDPDSDRDGICDTLDATPF